MRDAASGSRDRSVVRPRPADVRRLGVVGTLVWDSIWARDAGRRAPHEEWGGIAYALAAFDALRPGGWEMFPILKVGSDMAAEARRFLGGLASAGSLDGVRTVPEPNNRVELRYRDGCRRTERLRGGVPGWRWDELEPLARSCDALYVNFIAGWEIDLAAGVRLRDTFPGPLYCDVHSLLLGVGPGGLRVPRAPERWREWIGCFDYVQVNEDELELLASESGGDPWRLTAEVVGERPRALFVTLGGRGAAWVAADEALPRGRSGVRACPAVRSGRVPVPEVVDDPDPTGCGDVWGMTCFASLVAGAGVEEAARRANGLAARNASLRGTSSLAERLRSPRGILRSEEP